MVATYRSGGILKKEEARKWASMMSASTVRVDEVPEGWRTIQEIRRESGRSDSYTRKIINDLLMQGKVEQKKFIIKTAVRVYLVPHYRYVETD